MDIKEDLLPVNQFSRPGTKIIRVKAIVIHWVGKARETAAAVRSYFNYLGKQDPRDIAPDIYASAHYSIDEYNILRMIPEDEVAYHVGAWVYTKEAVEYFGKDATSNLPFAGSTPNFYTIGIELNHLEDGSFTDATYYTAVELTQDLCRRYDLKPDENILRHFDVTGKICPKWFVEHPADWECFIADVKGA